jgi:hypothetical protein
LTEHEHRTEEEVLEEQEDTVDDLEVPGDDAEGVAGGSWDIKKVEPH